MSTNQKTATEKMIINPGLANRIQEELGQNVYLCYQCVRCTGGCPMAGYFDWQPNQIMRALQLGQEEIALNAKTPWLCASCQTCTTRCPQGLDITAIMAFLTREALQRGIKPSVPEVNITNQAFEREVKLWGRSFELGLMAEIMLRTGKITDDLSLGVKVISKNKMPFLPSFSHPPKKVKPVTDKNAVGYYPGCSLHSTGVEFNISAKAVCEALDIHLVEPDGWVCCGSTPIHRADPEYALRLPMENLRLIEQSGLEEVTMPCAACFNHHKNALYEIRNHEDRKAAIDESMEYTYRDSVKVTTLYDSILEHIDPETLQGKITRPLKDLKVVCYYGCLLTRPPQVTESKHPENPTELDEMMKIMGAEVKDWSYKTCCCGATHSLSRPDIVHDLSSKLIKAAQQTGAEAIVVACPLCHTNLDARQFQMDLETPMPVLYFTQLLALALNLPTKAAALNKNLVDPRPLLNEKGILDR
ncbi:MAG: 4Fe-4S dicluster domain-containing protein [Anaerolineales bacterium]|nr:4Fe-4S dicluster domain-containing protein [Anaerolineales bacterium]